jgi:ATP-dependent exoDNAse (exonuclease V) beta subunit
VLGDKGLAAERRANAQMARPAAKQFAPWDLAACRGVFKPACPPRLPDQEGDLQMSADQREELRRDNTRRLYMGFTRAGMKLVVTWVGNLPLEWSPSAKKSRFNEAPGA